MIMKIAKKLKKLSKRLIDTIKKVEMLMLMKFNNQL